MVIRNLLIDHLGSDIAGYWDAMNRVSNIFAMIIATPISFYYLPRLSELVSKSELQNELKRGLVFVIPVAILGATCIYLTRDIIVVTLFSRDFLPMQDMFLFN